MSLKNRHVLIKKKLNNLQTQTNSVLNTSYGLDPHPEKARPQPG